MNEINTDKCSNLKDGICMIKNFKCKEIENCIFKFDIQIQQFKADNKELKRMLELRIEELCDSCGASSMMPLPCKLLEAENESLKKSVRKNKEKRKQATEKYQALKDYTNSKLDNGYLRTIFLKKLNEYQKCLDEIEEICKNSYTTEQQYYYHTSDTILQKIKEVKGE